MLCLSLDVLTPYQVIDEHTASRLWCQSDFRTETGATRILRQPKKQDSAEVYRSVCQIVAKKIRVAPISGTYFRTYSLSLIRAIALDIIPAIAGVQQYRLHDMAMVGRIAVRVSIELTESIPR
jgi:hypothetical protein